MNGSKLMLAAIERATPAQRSAAARPHICARCSRLEDQIRRDVPHWRPGVCESWVGTDGVRYWSGLCAECAALERSERVGAAVSNGMSRDVAEQKFGIRKTQPAAPARREHVG